MISKKIKGSNERCAIICHYLFYCSPSAQDIFEDKGSKGVCSFNTEGMPLWPSSRGTLGLHDVTEASSRGHEHSVNVSFAEQGSRDGNCGRDSDFGGLAKLALVAGGDVLFNIVSNQRPPEAIKEGV